LTTEQADGQMRLATSCFPMRLPSVGRVDSELTGRGWPREFSIHQSPNTFAPLSRSTQSDAKTPAHWPSDERLPRPGTTLTRRYKGRTLQVEVLEHGFAFVGQVYR
jgi:hypothetical protein